MPANGTRKSSVAASTTRHSVADVTGETAVQIPKPAAALVAARAVKHLVNFARHPMQALDHRRAVPPVARERELLAQAAIALRELARAPLGGANRAACSLAAPFEPALERIPFGRVAILEELLLHRRVRPTR